jgi:hypothetical protein
VAVQICRVTIENLGASFSCRLDEPVLLLGDNPLTVDPRSISKIKVSEIWIAGERHLGA